MAGASPLHDVDAAVRATLRETLSGQPADRPSQVNVALSGGRDSVTLLHACIAARDAGVPIILGATHVHHGLSSNADAWADFCHTLCAARRVPCTVVKVHVERAGGESLEGSARAARWQALTACGADVVALAHHADDQAETVLLQLLRGAGPRGLAGMPRMAGATQPRFVRPLLGLPSRVIEDYARQHALSWVCDESNADVALRRNFIRHEIAPRLRAAFPGYPDTLVRAAEHQAETASLLDALARIDAGVAAHDTEHGLALDCAELAKLDTTSPERARNVLRWFLRTHGLRAPSTAKLQELSRQCTTASHDARTALAHDGARLFVYAGRLFVQRGQPRAEFAVAWHGEDALPLPGGVLRAEVQQGAGLAMHVADTGAMVRSRRGGERLRVCAERGHRSVSAFLQATRTPPWQRTAWPILWHAERPVAVPGLGIDPAFAAAPDAPGYVLRWEPRRDQASVR